VSLGTIVQGVAEELIAAVLAAAGQAALVHARGTDWEAEVHAACQAGMEVAVREAARGLPPAAMDQAADSLSYDSEYAGVSGWLVDALARGVLSGSVDDSIRDDLRTILRPKKRYLAAQGIDVGHLIDVFPGAVVGDLEKRARPGEPLFPILQIMRLHERIGGLVWRIDVLREAVEDLHTSSRVPRPTTPVVSPIRPSSQPEIEALDGRIVETTALVLVRRDPPSLVRSYAGSWVGSLADQREWCQTHPKCRH